MTRLSRLLGALGPGELARRLGRSTSTVRRWSRSGKVPEEARDELRAVERRRQAARQAAHARREREANEARAREAKRREVEKRARAKAEKRAAEISRRKAEEAKAEALRRRDLAEKKALEEASRRRAEEAKRDLVAKARREAAAKAQAEAKRAREMAEARARAFELARLEKAAQARKALEAARQQRAEREAELKTRQGELVEACRLLQNNRGIAEAVGVDEATIRRWMEKPPFKSEAFDRLRRLIGSLHILLELMKQAGEIKKLPKVRPGHGVRSGRRTEGVYWTKTFMGFLDPVTISSIGRWIRSHGGNYPFWQVAVVTSQYALRSDVEFSDAGPKNTTRDYKTIFFQVSAKKWGDFAAERIEPSAETKSPGAAADDIEMRLRTRSQSGIVQVFVHGVTLFAYRRRTPEEEKQWATRERRTRQESWNKRQKSRAKKRRQAKKPK